MQLFKQLIKYPNIKWVLLDDSHVRAHQSSTGAVSIDSQDIAKSAGGNSFEIHLAEDAHGNPLDFLISDGVTHDIKVVFCLVSLIDLRKTAILNADKDFDRGEFRVIVAATGTLPNIPRKNSKTRNTHMDWHIYKARHFVENTFA